MDNSDPLPSPNGEPRIDKLREFGRSAVAAMIGGVLTLVILALFFRSHLAGLEWDGQAIGALGVLAVAFLGLVLAVWRFSLERTQASAAKQIADAAGEQAKVAEEQLNVGKKQIETADQQIELTRKQICAAKELAQGAERQEKIAKEHAASAKQQAETAKEQAASAKDLASSAKQQAETAKEQAEATKGQVAAAAKIAEAAERHAEAAKAHADAAQWRARIDEQSLRHDRYQRAVEMLGNRRVQAVRMGGVDLLRRLAEEQPEEFHVQVMGLLASFARHPVDAPADGAPVNYGRLRADVQAVMDAIGHRGNDQIETEKRVGFEVNLRGANLQGADLRRTGLESVNLEEVNLEGAKMDGTRLDGAKLGQAVLASKNAAVKGLEQEQLNVCSSDTTGEPIGLGHLEDLSWTPGTAPRREEGADGE